jgi:hypothetical protein
MIFVRFRRLELRGAGGWLGSTANREHSNGILRSRFCARAKVTIFCTEVTVAQLGLMSDVPNECGADQKVGDLARPALAGHRGALRGHIPSGILPRNPALKAATLLSRGFDLGARTAGIFHSDDSNSHPPRPGGFSPPPIRRYTYSTSNGPCEWGWEKTAATTVRRSRSDRWPQSRCRASSSVGSAAGRKIRRLLPR